MIKKTFTYFLGIIIIVYIFLGPTLFKKYWVDYRQIYENEEEKARWKGIITFWDYPKYDTITGNSYSYINQRIKEFEKAHPGVFIEYRSLEPHSGNMTLKAALKIGANPDIAPVGSDWYFISSGAMEALDEFISLEERNDFLEGGISSCSANDILYGIPWSRQAYTLLLNTDIFEERNIELPKNGQWGYEEFLESLKGLTKENKKTSKGEIFGLCGSMDFGFYNIFGILMCDGAKIIDNATGKYCFDSPEAISGLKKLCDLKNHHKVLYSDIGNISQKEAFNMFLSGKAAVFMGDAWMVSYLKNIGSGHDINFTTAYYPIGEAEYPVYLKDIYHSYGVFKQDDRDKREMCIEFIKHLTSRELQDELKKLGYFPVRKSSINMYQKDKEMYTIQKGLDYARDIPRHKKWWEIYEILQYNILEAMNEDKTPEEALNNAKEQVERLFH